MHPDAKAPRSSFLQESEERESPQRASGSAKNAGSNFRANVFLFEKIFCGDVGVYCFCILDVILLNCEKDNNNNRGQIIEDLPCSQALTKCFSRIILFDPQTVPWGLYECCFPVYLMKQAQRAYTARDPTVRIWHPGLTLDCQLFTSFWVSGTRKSSLQMGQPRLKGVAIILDWSCRAGVRCGGHKDWSWGKRGRGVRGGPPFQEQNQMWPS